ncbi:MAG: hypothetical protein ACI4PO_03775 [Faecousia sp.]
MGTLSDKLDYLEETKLLIREKLRELGAEVTDEDTFRSYVEKIEDANGVGYIPSAIRYALDNSVDNMRFEETVLGAYKWGFFSMICPRIVYPNEANGEYLIPFSSRGGNYAYNTVINGVTVSYHRVKAPETCKLKVALNMVKPGILILPTRVNLVQYTLYNGSSGTDASSFTTGLGFGQSVADSVSTWINRTLSTTKRVVKFPPGFKMDSGSTLYLSKIYITQDCMREMVQNLYDYIGNGETTEVTRTISVGSTNKALLTADEIALAKAKGWTISG